jgi:hypothetical protein
MAKGQNDEEEQKGGLAGSFLNVKNIILGILTVLTAYNTYRTQVTKDELSIQNQQIENNSALLDDAIKQKTFDNDLKFKLYGEVKDALVKADPNVQNVVLLIVNELLADDSLFRLKLQNILLTSAFTDNSVKQTIVEVQKTENQFKNDQADIMVLTKTNTTAYVIDIFYFQDIPGSKTNSQKIQKQLEAAFPGHSIRVRLLPKSVNAKKGYLIYENQIRYENSEREVAEKIRKTIEDSKILTEQPTLQKVRNVTTNYVSVFVRN